MSSRLVFRRSDSWQAIVVRQLGRRRKTFVLAQTSRRAEFQLGIAESCSKFFMEQCPSFPFSGWNSAHLFRDGARTIDNYGLSENLRAV